MHGPDWRLIQLDGGHWPMLTRAEEFHDLLVREIRHYQGTADDPSSWL